MLPGRSRKTLHGELHFTSAESREKQRLTVVFAFVFLFLFCLRCNLCTVLRHKAISFSKCSGMPVTLGQWEYRGFSRRAAKLAATSPYARFDDEACVSHFHHHDLVDTTSDEGKHNIPSYMLKMMMHCPLFVHKSLRQCHAVTRSSMHKKKKDKQ